MNGDASGVFEFIRPDGTFYDFQLAAVSSCCGRLLANGSAVLALDTGLGKTCVVKALVERLGSKTLVVAPGGLVRQLSQGLSRYPWGDMGSARVLRAETGKEMEEAKTKIHDILVVNRALRNINPTGYGLLVVDEAHQKASLKAASKLRKGLKVLLVTATLDTSCGAISAFLNGSWFWDTRDYFVVQKTPRVQELLGVARAIPVLLHLKLERPTKYAEDLIQRVATSTSFSLGARLRMMCAIMGAMPLAAGLGARWTAQILHLEGNSRFSSVPPGLRHRARALCAQHGVESPPHTPSHQDALGSHMPIVCDCCGVTERELRTLHIWHQDFSPPPPPPWEHRGLGVKSTLVRYSSRKALEESLSKSPPNSHVATFVLTSDKSASYRSKLISKFSSRDGSKMAIAVLERAIQNGPRHSLLVAGGLHWPRSIRQPRIVSIAP